MRARIFPLLRLVAPLILLLAVLPGGTRQIDAQESGPFAVDTPGDLDSTFDGDGQVITDFGGNDYGRAVVADTTGRIVVAGDTEVGGDIVLARYLADGTLDPSFGTGGRSTTDFGDYSVRLYGAARDAAGRIVIAGECAFDFALARYLADGTLDPSFGTGGKVITDIGGYDEPHAMAIDTGGRIIVVGSTYVGGMGHDFTLARYMSDGTLDASFGVGGKVITDLGGYDHAFAIALDTAGRIVAAGSVSDAYHTDFALVRYLTDGTLDPSFGTGGKVKTDFTGRGDAAFAVAVDAAGRIVVGGEADMEVGGYGFALARYLTDGSLDFSFGVRGKAMTDFGGYEQVRSVAIDTMGNILVAGFTGTADVADFAMSRYLADGTLDPTFGAAGKITTDFGGEDRAFAVSIYIVDRIVVAGYTRSSVSAGYDFAVARYLSGLPNYYITGRVTFADQKGVPGVTISAGSAGSAITNATGAYAIGNVITGTYTLTPALEGYTFDPLTRTVQVPPSDTGQDFELVPFRVHLPLVTRNE
jgi:uncharacterized delta-60 repeat protein